MFLDPLRVVIDVEKAGDVGQHLLGLHAPVRRNLQLRSAGVVGDCDRACADLPHVAVVLDALELRDQAVREIVEQMTPGERRADRQLTDEHDGAVSGRPAPAWRYCW
jgi:hypothetical protein